MTSAIEHTLSQLRLLPVATIASPEDAVPLARALVAGGLPIIEVALRTESAIEAIRRISEWDGIIVGAGTVVNEALCAKALAAGARFIVSPGLDKRIVQDCLEKDVPCFPGVCTPTELQLAQNLGLQKVKFFPAEALGGVTMLKALSAPFPQMQFLPTGGINLENLSRYLALEQTFAVGGSWMVHPKLFAEKDFSKVENEVQRAIDFTTRTPVQQSRT